jgi:hypothetical protein
MRKYKRDDLMKPHPDGGWIAESVFITGGYGNFAVVSFNGKILTEDGEEHLKRIQELDPDKLDKLRGLPDYITEFLWI